MPNSQEAIAHQHAIDIAVTHQLRLNGNGCICSCGWRQDYSDAKDRDSQVWFNRMLVAHGAYQGFMKGLEAIWNN